MEVGTRAFGTHDRSPLQTKLNVYRVADMAESLQQQLPNFAKLVKPEPPELTAFVEASSSSPASLLCRASNMFTGLQSKVEKSNPGASVSFPQRVKRELLSPSSCVTNDSVFHDTDVESLATAHANLMCSNAGEGDRPTEALQKLSEQVVSPSLMTAMVMLQESSSEQQQQQQHRMASSSSDMFCNGNATSVKRESIEAKEKLMTALDMLGGGLVCSDAHLERRKLEIVHPPEAAATTTPMNLLMTAMHMFPSEVPKLDVGCVGKSLVPTANVHNAPTTVLVHVKSEPLESSAALPELEQLKENNSNSQSFRNAVKEELLYSALETYRSGVFTNQAAHVSSESEYCSTGSEDNGDAEEDGCLVPKGVIFIDSQDVVSQKMDDGVLERSQREIKPRNSNPGRRIQGGRIYDSAFGKTCHWCRQKTVEHHVKCRECTIHYCGPCLMNRNGENIREELCEGVNWLCPKCRNGCGPGCENCCNCGPCRKALGKTPTGQMVGVARNAGFENAHDYLVHLETGESPEEIAQRKVGRGWTNCGRFKCTDTSETSESGDGASSSEGADEFTLNEEISTQLHQGKLDMKFVKRFVESQKRKRVAMRAPLPAKRRQVEASSAIKRRDVADILAGLNVTGRNLSKETEDAVKSASWRVNQKSKAKEKCTEDDSSIRNQDSGMRASACKREYVECDDGSNFGGPDVENLAVAKRRKLDKRFNGDQRFGLLNELSRPSLFSEVKCKIEPTTFSVGNSREFTTNADTRGGQGGTFSVSEREVILKMRGARALNGVSSASSMECPSDPQGTDYRMKLKSALAQSFDAKELEALDYSVRCRKPVQKLRQMRGRIVDVVTEDEGLSYLDHHQDFAAKLEDAQSPPEKLALLRGFFFWLQHSCMEGAFRPWPTTLTQSRHQSGDCMETEGPDCQVTAVVLQLDEGNEANRLPKPKFMKTVQRPLQIPKEMTSFPLGSSTSRQSLILFQAKKKFVQPVKPKMRSQLMEPPAKNYRVVLCLPAPALCKM